MKQKTISSIFLFAVLFSTLSSNVLAQETLFIEITDTTDDIFFLSKADINEILSLGALPTTNNLNDLIDLFDEREEDTIEFLSNPQSDDIKTVSVSENGTAYIFTLEMVVDLPDQANLTFYFLRISCLEREIFVLCGWTNHFVQILIIVENDDRLVNYESGAPTYLWSFSEGKFEVFVNKNLFCENVFAGSFTLKGLFYVANEDDSFALADSIFYDSFNILGLLWILLPVGVIGVVIIGYFGLRNRYDVDIRVSRQKPAKK